MVDKRTLLDGYVALKLDDEVQRTETLLKQCEEDQKWLKEKLGHLKGVIEFCNEAEG